jgi:uncharacterized protein involved in exopolysaccharide biosynthesis
MAGLTPLTQALLTAVLVFFAFWYLGRLERRLDRRIDRLQNRLNRLDARLDRLDSRIERLDELEAKLGGLRHDLDEVAGRLKRLVVSQKRGLGRIGNPSIPAGFHTARRP